MSLRSTLVERKVETSSGSSLKVKGSKGKEISVPGLWGASAGWVLVPIAVQTSPNGVD
jgi:hypothetical protein